MYGEIIIIKVGLGIFGLSEIKLCGKNFEETIFFLRNVTFDIKEEDLLKCVYNNKLKIEKWDEKYNFELKVAIKKSMEF